MKQIVRSAKSGLIARLFHLTAAVAGFVPMNDLRSDERGEVDLSPAGMVAAIMFIFVISILGAAFTGPLQGQVNNWTANLTANNQSAAAAVVSLVPLIFWILLAVAIILAVVAAFLPRGGQL